MTTALTKYHHVTVFFTNGVTARFHEVVIGEDTNEFFGFWYTSASDNFRNYARVARGNVAAIAVATDADGNTYPHDVTR